MENLGEAFIEGKKLNLDTTDVKELEMLLKSVQKRKSGLKDQLDDILEEIYN